jgi:hypothetical protein
LLDLVDLLALLDLRADFFVDLLDFLDALERDDVFGMDSVQEEGHHQFSGRYSHVVASRERPRILT